MELQGTIDEVIAKELTIDLSSGNFYKEVDDETLQMALVAMYENIEAVSYTHLTLPTKRIV